MKKALLALLLAVVSLSFAASFSVQTGSALHNEKIADRSPKTDREDVVLNYDLEDYSNSIGTGAAGSFEASAKFTPTELAEHAGKNLNKVSIFLGSDAGTLSWSSVAIKVYKGTEGDAPVTELCNVPIPDAQPAVWTEVDISSSGIVIEADTDYWIGYTIEATGDHPLGCDAGPVVAGKGQWIKYEGAWSELSALSSTLTYNWHIRATLGGTPGPDINPPTVVSLAGNSALPDAPMNLTLVVSDFTGVPATITAVYNIGAGDQTITMTQSKKAQYTYTGTIPAQTAVTGTIKFNLVDTVVPPNADTTDTYPIKWEVPTFAVFGDGEGFEGTFVPDGWTNLDVDGGAKTWEQASGVAHGGAKYAWHNYAPSSAGEQNGMLILPQFQVAADGKLKFWEKQGFVTYYYYHGIYVSTTTPDAASFTELEAVPVCTANWAEKIIDLSAYAGQTIYLAFVYQGTDADTWWIDDVHADASNEPFVDDDAPVCAAPTGVNALPGTAMTISTVVTDYTGIASVVGHYKLAGQETWTDITMTASKVSGTYTGTIPAQPDIIAGVVKFTATDTVTPTANAGDSPEFDIAWAEMPDIIEFSFDDLMLPSEWTVLDADGDGNNWTTERPTGFETHDGSAGAISSASFMNDKNNKGALTPDNYLIVKQYQATATSSVKFWVCAQDAAWAAEHYGLGVSTTGTAAADFTMVFEETLTAKGAGAWYEKSVDLSSYAGQNVYIAFRHWNCTDMFWINMDDVKLYNFDPAGIEDNNTTAKAATLSQNYPNPFNPSTSINFYNNITGDVKLTVMNAKGEQVATLVNNKMTAGNHSVNFDGSNLNSGVYFYKLVTPTATVTKKMLLVK